MVAPARPIGAAAGTHRARTRVPAGNDAAPGWILTGTAELVRAFILLPAVPSQVDLLANDIYLVRGHGLHHAVLAQVEHCHQLLVRTVLDVHA